MGGEASTGRGRKPVKVGGGSEDLAQDVASLSTLNAAALGKRWNSLFGADPSPLLGRVFMIRAIAYRLQEKAFGGLKPSVQRLLDRLCDKSTDLPLEQISKRRPGAGTVLVREWRGVSHRVTVFDHDVVYRGRRYKSLSEVARMITGARWSGPLFFGLESRAKKVVND